MKFCNYSNRQKNTSILYDLGRQGQDNSYPETAIHNNFYETFLYLCYLRIEI